VRSKKMSKSQTDLHPWHVLRNILYSVHNMFKHLKSVYLLFFWYDFASVSYQEVTLAYRLFCHLKTTTDILCT